MNQNRLDTPFGDIFFSGPPLNQGPLPAFFYFSLSAQESLFTDPYNQPIVALNKKGIRCFSITLPLHEKDAANSPEENYRLNKEAVDAWKNEQNFLILFQSFIERVINSIHYLVENEIVVKEKIALGGLSRGALIAVHVLSKLSFAQVCVGFSPLTELHPHDLSLHKLGDILAQKWIRFYIGNYDQRVGTKTCFECIEAWVETARKQSVRSPRFELHLFPSIGHLGHGTPSNIFLDGAEYIAHHLSLESP